MLGHAVNGKMSSPDINHMKYTFSGAVRLSNAVSRAEASLTLIKMKVHGDDQSHALGTLNIRYY